MINGIGSPLSATTAPAAKPDEGPATSSGFDAALKAAQNAAAKAEAREKEKQSILDKGFSDWVRDMKIEKLKEELRKKVMADMGLTEDQLAKMEAVMRQILEQKIQEEVEKQLAEAVEQEQKGTQLAGAPGKNGRTGKTCPVVPALAWPGGASVF